MCIVRQSSGSLLHIPEGPELAAVEEHLLIRGECVNRAQEMQDYVDAIQAGNHPSSLVTLGH